MNYVTNGDNVITSVVVPSTIDTPQNRKAMPDANYDNWVKLKRWLLPSIFIIQVKQQC